MNDDKMVCDDCCFAWVDAGQDVCPCCGSHNIGYEYEDDEDEE